MEKKEMSQKNQDMTINGEPCIMMGNTDKETHHNSQGK